ncbi:hypothetical protein AGMMS50296_5530 [Alphaproteobacteria bacterium]|nr:hypothetical protein AGMMS50296_5530 [Alphaproteobacteria bacterium]
MSKSFQVKALAKSLLFQVFCSLSLGILLAPFLSNVTASFFYSVSCTIKDILVFFLPVVIFSYLVSSLIFYEKDATRIVGCVFLGVLLSIFMALGYAYGVGRFFLQDFVTAHSPVAVHSSENVQTLWPFPFQSFSTDRAMLFSLLFAFWINALQSSFLTRFRTSHYNKMDSASVPGNMLKGLFSLGLFAHPSHLAALKQSISKMKDVSEKALLALFIPIIPLYVFGFILKISKESLPGAFLKEFSHVFMLSFVAFIPFIMLAYFVAARFKGRTAGTFFKNMLPPYRHSL